MNRCVHCHAFGLGIATLLLVVPVPLGVAHQAGAVLLVTSGILVMHSLRDDARPSDAG